MLRQRIVYGCEGDREEGIELALDNICEGEEKNPEDWLKEVLIGGRWVLSHSVLKQLGNESEEICPHSDAEVFF